MILTSEGWEPGTVKPAYVEQAALAGISIDEIILDELNPPDTE